jgi:hypothetical protein
MSMSRGWFVASSSSSVAKGSGKAGASWLVGVVEVARAVSWRCLSSFSIATACGRRGISSGQRIGG